MIGSKVTKFPFFCTLPYYKNGQATLNTMVLGSRLLAKHLQKDVFLFGTRVRMNHGRHTISLFRPALHFPVLIFEPLIATKGSSTVGPLDVEMRSELVMNREAFSFISNPDHITKKDLGL